MNEKNKRAWIYTRIDAPEDEHGALKMQEKDLIGYAEQIGATIAGTCSDLGSGLDYFRPGLCRMQDAAREGRFDILLVKSLSRLGRDNGSTIDLLRRLNELGVRIFSPLEGEIKLENPLFDSIQQRME